MDRGVIQEKYNLKTKMLPAPNSKIINKNYNLKLLDSFLHENIDIIYELKLNSSIFSEFFYGFQ
jgi:hypothetical protein